LGDKSREFCKYTSIQWFVSQQSSGKMQHPQFPHTLSQAASQQISLFGGFCSFGDIDDRAYMCGTLTIAAIDRNSGQFDMPD
jgi:hypothetical protein